MKKKKSDRNQRIINGLIAAVIIFSILFFVYAMYGLFSPKKSEKSEIQSTGKMGLTAFDIELAKSFMDKDNDGKCDSCGMPVEMCIDSGQMQCNMDSKSTIGVLGSQHIHADFKVYIDGKALDFSEYDHMSRIRANLPVSSFIHADSGAPAPEKTGDILHMHATGVPLWVFLKSIDLELQNETRLYVNGKEIQDFDNYIFKDLDKILITDGKGDLQKQLTSITDFAKIH